MKNNHQSVCFTTAIKHRDIFLQVTSAREALSLGTRSLMRTMTKQALKLLGTVKTPTLSNLNYAIFLPI